MKLIRFRRYRDYVRSQMLTVRRRSHRCFFRREEMSCLADWFKTNRNEQPKMVLCHGARGGHECDEFATIFPEAVCVGTDLFPFTSTGGVKRCRCDVIKHDFSSVRAEWTGKADIVYSNSLDHVRDPLAALSVWMDQLAPGGVVALQWSLSHRRASRGDCFGATLCEYVCLGESVGKVIDLLFIPSAVARRKVSWIVLILVEK